MRQVFLWIAMGATAAAQASPRVAAILPDAPHLRITRDGPATWNAIQGEVIPDAPQPQASGWQQQWDYNRPQRSYRETIRDPWFIVPFVSLLAANAIDIEATKASGCGERREFGRQVSRAELYGEDFGVDLAVGMLAFFLHKSHIKVIPQAMLGYGIGIHVRGAVRGFQASCR